MQDQIYQVIDEVESYHWWYRVRRELAVSLLEKYADRGSRILDIGCGAGLLMKELREKGYAVQGVDYSDLAVAYCHSKGLTDVRQGSATSLPFADNSLDVVLLLDVLEHIQDDKAAIAEARRVLKTNGLIIVFAPCFSLLWGYLDIVGNHYRRYTLPELEVIFQNKFKIIKKTYFNFFLFAPIFITRLTMRLLGLKDQEEAKINSPALNKLLYFIFSLEEKMIKRGWCFPFGVSALVVAKKYA